MLTKQDMQLLRREFVTKKEFAKKLNKLSDDIIEVINAVGNNIMVELGAKIDDISDILENHERRVEKLELKLPL